MEHKHPKFDINSAYYKLYEANGEKEVILTAYEADNLLDYVQYMCWLTNPPKKKIGLLERLFGIKD